LIRWKWKIGWNVVTNVIIIGEIMTTLVNMTNLHSYWMKFEWIDENLIVSTWLHKSWLSIWWMANHGHSFSARVHQRLSTSNFFISIFHLCAYFEFQELWLKSNVGRPLVGQC
jgi:hypothetical protein